MTSPTSYRFHEFTKDQMVTLKETFGFDSQAAVIKAAVDYMYVNRKRVDGWRHYGNVMKGQISDAESR